MPQRNVLILFSDTGGGHRSAAEAIESAVLEVAGLSSSTNKIQVFAESMAEKTHPVNRIFVEFYNYLLRRHQPLMKYYYSFIHLLKPNQSRLGYLLSSGYIKELLRRINPHVIVSVHPMTNHHVARALSELGLKRKVQFITVVTDPNGDLWKGWACPEADLTIAPNELAADKLKQWGVPDKKLSILGMPVNPAFLRSPTVSKEEFRVHLGLYRDRFTVFINSGWAGGGNMLAVYQSLSSCHLPIQIIFICGHNQALFNEARKLAHRADVPTAVLPFHDSMSDLMAASDLMVTKAGGLTTFEGLARGIPMALDLITPPMPQEKGTVDVLVSEGMAEPIHKPQDIISIAERHLSGKITRRPLPANHYLNRTYAVYDMATAILTAADPDFRNPVDRSVDSTLANPSDPNMD